MTMPQLYNNKVCPYIIFIFSKMLYDFSFLNAFSEHILIDHAKWSNYNQSLVRRDGEILIGFDVVDSWDKELKRMKR